MPFVAKVLVPTAGNEQAAHSAFADMGHAGIIILEDPEGCLPAEQLASALMDTGLRPVWLRLGPEDRDPGSFLLSMITAARRCYPGIGTGSLRLMQDQPGPIYGWPALYAQFGRELRECLAGQRALILEDPHDTWPGSTTFPLIRMHLLPLLAPVALCVLVARSSPPADALGCVLLPAPELRVPATVTDRILAECAPQLSGRLHDRALAVIGGRQTVLAGLEAVCAGTGESGVAPLLEHARSWEQLLARIAGTLLRPAGDEGRRELGLMVRTEYAHPAVTGAASAGGSLPRGPWLQSLEDGWARVRPCWRRPLQVVLGRNAAPGRDVLHRVADRLLDTGADERAIALYLELGDHECAAGRIAAIASTLMDLGEWATLGGWLNRLPDEALSRYPDLIYHRADIAAARGKTALAVRGFSNAASRFCAENDVAGTCRSLLAASAAATDSGDPATALARASTASSLADAANLTELQMWATWQQGRVALLTGDTETALVSFRLAAAIRPPDAGAETRLVRRAGELCLQLAELRKRQAAHREAQAALSSAEHQTLSELVASVSMHDRRDSSPAGLGWSKTPAPLKIHGPAAPAPGRAAWPAAQWARLRRTLPGGGHAVGSGPADGARAGPAATGSAVIRQVINTDPAGGPDPPATAPAPAVLPAVMAPWRAEPTGPDLAVHLLGPFHVSVDDVPVGSWPSARARSLFGYLLTHRQPWPPREVLREVFWPASPPRASRNNLNVTLHGLRQILRTVTAAPVIVYARGVYRIHPAVRLWLDVEEFDELVGRGSRLEEAGEFGRAAEAYESAAELYRGEFLADDPYEEWAALTRDRLRLTYLDALGRLSGLRFSAGQYAASANLCRRIIEQDSCREDAHRRLMRCYSRQGQRHLALMQYHACVRALANDLGVEPEQATWELNERVRQHEPV